MLKVGGRTTRRMMENVFKTTPLTTIVGKAPRGMQVCNGICEVFCEQRNEVLIEMIKNKPDPTTISEVITDFRTISDFLDGGKCQCECGNINTILPFLLQGKVPPKE